MATTQTLAAQPQNLGRYTGPAYPFGSVPALVFGPRPDVNVILASIGNIITTPRKSIPWNPQLGSRIPYLVFDINDAVTQGLIKYFTQKDISEQDPRVIINSVQINLPQDGLSVEVLVSFSIAGDALGQIYSAPVNFPSLDQ